MTTPQTPAEPTIIRAKHDASTRWFLTLRSSAQDNELSFLARGILWYLLSKPDDWTVQIADLQKQGGIGRDKVKKALIELADHNYLERPKRYKDDAGKWDWTPYVLHEQPFTENQSMDGAEDEKPVTEKPSTGNQSLENRPMVFQSILVNTDSQTTEEQKTEEKVKSSSDEPSHIDEQGRATTTAGVAQRWFKITTRGLSEREKEFMLADVEEHGLDAANEGLDIVAERIKEGKRVHGWKYASPIIEECAAKPPPKVPAKGSPNDDHMPKETLTPEQAAAAAEAINNLGKPKEKIA